MDESKKQQAIKIIATEAAKEPANTIMDYGTAGHSFGVTKRQGKCRSMAMWIVEKMEKVTLGDTIYPTDEQKKAYDLMHEIENAALEICGK